MSLISEFVSIQNTIVPQTYAERAYVSQSGSNTVSSENPTAFSKRTIDIVGALLGLVLLSPVFVLIAIAMKLESRGPVFFIQDRWGKDLKIIKVIKFRTMHFQRCDPSGVNQTCENDPRVTKLGQFLRSSNLDEIPQLINVLKGEMSLVGPRCHPIGMRAAGMPYESLVRGYHLRHTIAPGITGLAQVNGLRGPTVDAQKATARICYDRLYLRQRSVWLDLRIIVQTLFQELHRGSGF